VHLKAMLEAVQQRQEYLERLVIGDDGGNGAGGNGQPSRAKIMGLF